MALSDACIRERHKAAHGFATCVAATVGVDTAGQFAPVPVPANRSISAGGKTKTTEQKLLGDAERTTALHPAMVEPDIACGKCGSAEEDESMLLRDARRARVFIRFA